MVTGFQFLVCWLSFLVVLNLQWLKTCYKKHVLPLACIFWNDFFGVLRFCCLIRIKIWATWIGLWNVVWGRVRQGNWLGKGLQPHPPPRTCLLFILFWRVHAGFRWSLPFLPLQNKILTHEKKFSIEHFRFLMLLFFVVLLCTALYCFFSTTKTQNCFSWSKSS